jgi:alpha-1,2-mannosyltransferase
LIVGVFSPVINWCGGAEWVAVNIVNALKEHGHQVIVLSDEPLNQNKFLHVFDRKVLADQQIVFPLRFFSATNYHNIYTDSIRISVLKSKCKVVIDTFSNAMLPGAAISYIHHPVLRKVAPLRDFTLRERVYYSPYRTYLNFKKGHFEKRLILANSKFTAAANKAETGADASVIYPPISNSLYCHESEFDNHRDNNVTAVARICFQKKLDIIPYIAKATRKDISFIIVGLLDSKEALNHLIELGTRLGVSDRIKIMTNVTRERLRSILLNSKVFLHTSVNEHFGISIVEAMASGCIPVVHDSGGPREFVPPNQRYNSKDEAAEIVERATANWSPTEARKISNSAKRFSESNFAKQFIDAFNSHFQDDAKIRND